MRELSCTHPQLDSQDRCSGCGAQFVQVWREFSAIRYGPLLISFVFTGVFGWLFLRNLGPDTAPLATLLPTLVGFYFLLRVIRGTLDLFTPPVNYGGQVLSIKKRGMWNLFSTRDASVSVGRRQFGLGAEAARHLTEGEPVLFRYMRWTRTVMGIYKPTQR